MAKTVLIVEDNELNMKLFHDLLEAHCYIAFGTRNGIEALDYLHNHNPPALIILDLMMPVMDGRQFRAEQLRDAALRDIPTLICTCEPTPERTAGELGVRGYVSKDGGLRRFVDAVVDLCP